MSQRWIFVVRNPRAGTKAGLATNTVSLDELRAALAEHDIADALASPESEAEAIEQVGWAVDAGYEVIAAAGGDGTVGLVARQLIGTPVALGILPLGSAMNVGRSLAIPRDLRAAVQVLASGPVREIDVGLARGDHVFLELASIGLSAEMFAEGQGVDRGHYERLAGLVRAIWRFRPHRIEVTLDDRTIRTRAIMVAVANGPYTGLGLTLAPDARLDDGQLEVAVYGHFLRWELVRHLFGVLAGRHRYSPKIRSYRATRVQIRSRTSLPVRADAADLGWTPVDFSVRRAALRVVVPPDPARL